MLGAIKACILNVKKSWLRMLEMAPLLLKAAGIIYFVRKTSNKSTCLTYNIQIESRSSKISLRLRRLLNQFLYFLYLYVPTPVRTLNCTDLDLYVLLCVRMTYQFLNVSQTVRPFPCTSSDLYVLSPVRLFLVHLPVSPNFVRLL